MFAPFAKCAQIKLNHLAFRRQTWMHYDFHYKYVESCVSYYIHKRSYHRWIAKYVNKINHGRTKPNRVNKEKERRVILITISFLRNIINSYWVEMLSGLKVWSGMVYWSGLVWRWYLFHNVVSFHSNDKQFLFKSNHFRIESISNKTFKHTKNLVLYAIKLYDHSISKCDEIMLFCVLSCLADCHI